MDESTAAHLATDRELARWCRLAADLAALDGQTIPDDLAAIGRHATHPINPHTIPLAMRRQIIDTWVEHTTRRTT